MCTCMQPELNAVHLLFSGLGFADPSEALILTYAQFKPSSGCMSHH